MSDSYDLTQLEPNAFEHMVNALALRALGAGHTGFGPGADGGRDGYFEGEAPYPSDKEKWRGRWYIQSKFHKPHLTTNAQTWLVNQIRDEIKAFEDSNQKRIWPDNWIIATNIDPSGVPETGAFDRAKKLVTKANSKLASRFHIWGGQKILDLLDLYPEVRDAYGHFLTPGHILTSIRQGLEDQQATVEAILRSLIVKQFEDQQHTKLDQAGSDADTRSGIHRLFIDLPFQDSQYNLQGYVIQYLVRTAAKCHRIDGTEPDNEIWRSWRCHPSRARVWFVRGGPGQGKSTLSQYVCQLQRAALILQQDSLPVIPAMRTLAREIKEVAEAKDFWSQAPRVPIYIELREFAQWFGEQSEGAPRGILTYLARDLTSQIEQPVLVGTLGRALGTASWLAVFDGLDEVPTDIKDDVAYEVRHFIDEVALRYKADLFTLCTSRPQGYSGQFSQLDGPEIALVHLSPDQAIACAKPVLAIERPESDVAKFEKALASAIQSPAVRDLMQTPLQTHIMAVVVRSGGKPPERRWQLFNNFYDVIRRREANKELADQRLVKLLREQEQLLKTLHNRLGFVLHAEAETKSGATTSLDRAQFERLARDAVEQMIDENIDETVDVLMTATKERLVLVNTPDDGEHLRFDIRQLQEFFAAEFLYESVKAEELRDRLEIVAGDAHWREVLHFLMSALVENQRATDLDVAISVLTKLNEADPGTPERTLAKRLGRGALIAAHLLQEGVLEQDRRTRQQFRQALEPLLAFSVFNPDDNLVKVDQENSRSWLVNFLIERIKEADPTESIGASILLTMMVINGDDRCDDVKCLIQGHGPEYVSAVIRGYLAISKANDAAPFWVIELALDRLLSPEWRSLDVASTQDCLRLLERNKNLLDKILDDLNIGTGLRSILYPCLNFNVPIFDHRVMEEVDFDGLKIIYRLNDWSNEGQEVDQNLSNSDEDFGFFQLPHRLMKFSSSVSKIDFIAALELLTYTKEPLTEVLPGIVRSYFPEVYFAVDIPKLITEVRNMSDNEFSESIKMGAISDYRLKRCLITGRVTEVNHNNLLYLIANERSTAIYLLYGIHRFPEGVDDSKDEQKVISALINTLLDSPEMMFEHPEYWGPILRDAGVHAEELRGFLTAKAREFLPRRIFIASEKILPFAIH